MARTNHGGKRQTRRFFQHKRRGLNTARTALWLESLESRIVLDGSGFAGNDCPPDLDLSGVAAQQVTVGQTLTLDLLAAGGTVVDLDSEGEETGDVIRLLLDPDVPADTPAGASLTPAGVFSWTPTAGQVGTFTIVVIAVDQGTPPLADAETFVVEVAAGNQAPSVDLNGAAAGIDFIANFTEGEGPVEAVAAAGLTVTDADDDMLETATATIANLADGASEVLAVDTSGTGIAAVYDDTTGVLSLTGSDTLAAYQQVLRTLTYNHTSQDPTAGDRLIQVVVNDGDQASPVATTTLSVASANDPPVLDLNGEEPGSDFETTFTEGGGAVAAVGSGLTVTDVDHTLLETATVTLTNLLDGAAEVLEVDTGGTAITANFVSGVLTLTGPDSVAAYQQVLRTLTYNNTSADPATTARLVEFMLDDGLNGSTVRTSTINMVAVNNPPNLAEIDDQTATVDEELVVFVTATDAESGDVLTFDLDSDNSPDGAMITQTSNTTAEIRWTPPGADLGMTVGFVVLVSDDGTPMEADSESFSVTVEAPRPVVDLNGDGEGIDFGVVFVEDGGAVPLTDADVAISSPTSSTIDGLTATLTNLQDGAAEVLEVDTSGTSITASYDAGVLTLSGEDSIANYTAVLATLTYEHTSQDPTEGERTISVVASDGTNDSLAAVATVAVFAVNDDPNLEIDSPGVVDGVVTVEAGLQTIVLNTSVTDVDHEPSEWVYQIDADGVVFPAGQDAPTVSQSDDAFPGNVSFLPRVPGEYTFNVIVTDAAGGSDQETLTFVVTETIPPTVTAAPTGTLAGPITSLSVEYSESMASQSFNAANYALTVLGGPSDGDPVIISDVSTTTFNSAVITLASGLADGNYRLSLTPANIKDIARNPLEGVAEFDFSVENAVAAAFAEFGLDS